MRTAPRVLAAGALGSGVLVLVVTDLAVRARHPSTFPPDGGTGLPVACAIDLATLAFTAVGVLLVARVRGNAYGWAPASLGVAMAELSCGSAVGEVGALPRWLELPVASSAVPVTFVAASAVFALFPSGRLPGPRWRWLGRVTVAAAALAVVLALLLGPDRDIPGLLGPGEAHGPVGEAISPALILVLTACLLAAVLALVARRRRAGPVERQQLRWLVAAGVAFAGLVLVANVASTLFSDEDTGLVVGIATGVSWLLVPSAIGVAVTRHRLYDLDRLVSRTVSYALLTGLLSAVYLGVVAGLRRVLEPLSGTSQLAVGVSTLVVAAAFNPVRRRVQSIVDRRFDRSRYDAARTVDAYARRLRTEVDLDEVTAGLRNTVSATVGPQRVGLWLRPRAD